MATARDGRRTSEVVVLDDVVAGLHSGSSPTNMDDDGQVLVSSTNDDASVASDHSSTSADVPEASTGRKRLRHVLAVALLVAAFACIAAVVLVVSHRNTRFKLPPRLTVKFQAFDKLNTSNVALSGTLFKVPAAADSEYDWHTRGVASYSGAGGSQRRVVTVMDDQGVEQTFDAGSDALVATACARPTRVVSIPSAIEATDDATVVSEDEMKDIVGGGACEGAGFSRVLVRIGDMPLVVCWTGDFENVAVSGKDFFAVAEVSTTVSDEEMNAVSMPQEASDMQCELYSPDDVAAIRRLQSGPRDAHGRRLCEDCGTSFPPPSNNCCRRRLDGTLDVQPVPADDASRTSRRRRRRRRRRLGGEQPLCLADSNTAPTKRCVFVHGLMVEEQGAASVAGNFPQYWGDVKSRVKEFCTEVRFVRMDASDRNILEPSVAQELCSLLANGENNNIKDTLLFVHGAGNVMLANGLYQNYCSKDPSTYWFEIQNGRSLSRIANWGAHFCEVETEPSHYRRLGKSVTHNTFDSFVSTYPFCSPDFGRRLAVGLGTLDRAWAQIAYDQGQDFSAFKTIIASEVSGFMCATEPGNSSPEVTYDNILENSWDMQYDPYPASNAWSNCWTDAANEMEDDYRSMKYDLGMSTYDATCRAGNAWYAATGLDSMQPCGWYRQMACLFGSK